MLDRFSAPALLLPYGLLLAFTVLGNRPAGGRPAWFGSLRLWATALALGGLAIGAAAAWNAYLHRPDGRRHVTFLNVGDGQAVLIQTSGGRYALLDGGPSPNGLAESLGRVLPAGARTLDLVLATSPGEGSLAGLPGLFDRFDIGQAVQMEGASKGAAYQEWAPRAGGAPGAVADGIARPAVRPGRRRPVERCGCAPGWN
jgi:beta-lactamase superfamily II metal-dependent hydrolase